ncbi:MAG: hypothetical protein DCC68_17795 [Planctomycetota bacterium]|nr:MAG: hypothetical protein DCC68_17795 [Planctomycetota bacterium]
MARFREQIACYLDLARHGDADNAFHGLRELGDDALPALVEAFGKERDASIRELLIQAIWEMRNASAIAVLHAALRDSDRRVRYQALDGLVAFASPEALAVLQEARSLVLSSRSERLEFRQYHDEAIEQVLAGGF